MDGNGTIMYKDLRGWFVLWFLTQKLCKSTPKPYYCKFSVGRYQLPYPHSRKVNRTTSPPRHWSNYSKLLLFQVYATGSKFPSCKLVLLKIPVKIVQRICTFGHQTMILHICNWPEMSTRKQIHRRDKRHLATVRIDMGGAPTMKKAMLASENHE